MAFCDGGQPFETSCAAALRLYVLSASAARHTLDEAQEAVVAHACRLAGYPSF